MDRSTRTLKYILVILVAITIVFGWVSRMFTPDNWADIVITILGLYVVVATLKMK